MFRRAPTQPKPTKEEKEASKIEMLEQQIGEQKERIDELSNLLSFYQDFGKSVHDALLEMRDKNAYTPQAVIYDELLKMELDIGTRLSHAIQKGQYSTDNLSRFLQADSSKVERPAFIMAESILSRLDIVIKMLGKMSAGENVTPQAIEFQRKGAIEAIINRENTRILVRKALEEKNKAKK